MSASIEFGRNAANFVPLSPLSFLARMRDVFPERAAVIYGHETYTWRQAHDRAARLASALGRHGIGVGDAVSVMLANTPPMFDAHFGVPMAGGVLNAINTRLDADTVAYILEHSDSKLLIADSQFAPVVAAALGRMGGRRPIVIDYIDIQVPGGNTTRLGSTTYDELIAGGDPSYPWAPPSDEWQSLALNYTSGTSGRPKGVLYHHRGAYLMSLGTIAAWGLPPHPTYLYTVPMFHCNGWCHAWTLAAVAGTAVLCRQVSAADIFRAIEEEGVTHFGGAPIVLAMLVNAPETEIRKLPRQVKVMTAGAPPPAAIIDRMQALGFDVMQVYGLTETFGHVVHCAWKSEWDALDGAGQAEIKARQGVRLPTTEEVEVIDVATGTPVPHDGRTMGEIVIRGNTVMKGYHKDEAATTSAFAGGWFHSGDLAVTHPDGYIEIKDRLKDIIISGGENISSVEIEGVLYKHPAVVAAAVVAQPDPKWGESPCAFVELKAGTQVSEADIIAFCRQTLAGFKVPKRVVFGDLPKTSTGKIQKFVLRQAAKGS